MIRSKATNSIQIPKRIKPHPHAVADRPVCVIGSLIPSGSPRVMFFVFIAWMPKMTKKIPNRPKMISAMSLVSMFNP